MKPLSRAIRFQNSVAAGVRPRQRHESAPTNAGGYATLKDAGKRAFTLTELLVVLVLAVVLLVFALPTHNIGRRSGEVRCLNNLKQAWLAFGIWANDHGSNFPMSVSTNGGGTLELIGAGAAFPHFQILSNELNGPNILVCPLDASRSPATNFTSDLSDARLSYFVGVDTAPANPRGLLTGDRNLTLNGQTGLRGLVALATNAPASWVTTNLHKTLGVVGFADGSVQRMTTAQLRQALAASGMTNRLAIP